MPHLEDCVENVPRERARVHESAHLLCVNGTPICGTRTVLSTDMAPATGATHANSGEAAATG